MYLGFPDMKGSGILQLTEDEIERVVCAVKGRLRGTGWWRLVWLSSFLLSGAAQREEKLVKTLIVAIKGYWLSFPPCLGDKVSISWSHRELFKTRFLRGRPVPLGCPLLRSRARARTHTHAHKCAAGNNEIAEPNASAAVNPALLFGISVWSKVSCYNFPVFKF